MPYVHATAYASASSGLVLQISEVRKCNLPLRHARYRAVLDIARFNVLRGILLCCTCFQWIDLWPVQALVQTVLRPASASSPIMLDKKVSKSSKIRLRMKCVWSACILTSPWRAYPKLGASKLVIFCKHGLESMSFGHSEYCLAVQPRPRAKATSRPTNGPCYRVFHFQSLRALEEIDRVKVNVN